MAVGEGSALPGASGQRRVQAAGSLGDKMGLKDRAFEQEATNWHEPQNQGESILS